MASPLKLTVFVSLAFFGTVLLEHAEAQSYGNTRARVRSGGRSAGYSSSARGSYRSGGGSRGEGSLGGRELIVSRLRAQEQDQQAQYEQAMREYEQAKSQYSDTSFSSEEKNKPITPEEIKKDKREKKRAMLRARRDERKAEAAARRAERKGRKAVRAGRGKEKSE